MLMFVTGLLYIFNRHLIINKKGGVYKKIFPAEIEVAPLWKKYMSLMHFSNIIQYLFHEVSLYQSHFLSRKIISPF